MSHVSYTIYGLWPQKLINCAIDKSYLKVTRYLYSFVHDRRKYLSAENIISLLQSYLTGLCILRNVSDLLSRFMSTKTMYHL